MKTLKCTQTLFVVVVMFLLFSCNSNKEEKVENLKNPVLNIADLLSNNAESEFTSGNLFQ